MRLYSKIVALCRFFDVANPNKNTTSITIEFCEAILNLCSFIVSIGAHYMCTLMAYFKILNTFQIFKESQRILERQRFQFPQNWLHSDNIEGEWTAFCDILDRKDTSIQGQVNFLNFCVY